MSDAAYYKSLTTPVLRKMWDKLRKHIMSLPEEDREHEDYEALIAMRDELDRRSGGKPIIEDFNFEKYVTK